jgi:hypothetical protein
VQDPYLVGNNPSPFAYKVHYFYKVRSGYKVHYFYKVHRPPSLTHPGSGRIMDRGTREVPCVIMRRTSMLNAYSESWSFGAIRARSFVGSHPISRYIYRTWSASVWYNERGMSMPEPESESWTESLGWSWPD